jgi:hypothetical protein
MVGWRRGFESEISHDERVIFFAADKTATVIFLRANFLTVPVPQRPWTHGTVRDRKRFKRGESLRAIRRRHVLYANQSNRDAEFALRQLLHSDDFSQVLQIKRSERGYHVELNAGLIGVPLRRKVESAAAEIPHAANFFEVPAYRICGLDVDKAVDLNAWFATAFESF